MWIPGIRHLKRWYEKGTLTLINWSQLLQTHKLSTRQWTIHIANAISTGRAISPLLPGITGWAPKVWSQKSGPSRGDNAELDSVTVCTCQEISYEGATNTTHLTWQKEIEIFKSDYETSRIVYTEPPQISSTMMIMLTGGNLYKYTNPKKVQLIEYSELLGARSVFAVILAKLWS